METTNEPFLGFSLFISILVKPASFKAFSTLADLVLNTPHDLQASIETLLDLLLAPAAAAEEEEGRAEATTTAAAAVSSAFTLTTEAAFKPLPVDDFFDFESVLVIFLLWRIVYYRYTNY